MAGIKKFFKMAALVSIIVLASIGVGIAGGLPSVSGNRKQDKSNIQIELFEEKDKEKSVEFLDIHE